MKNEFNLFKKNYFESKRMNMFRNSNIVQYDENDLILSWFEKKPISFNLLLDSKIDGIQWMPFIINVKINIQQ